MIIVRDTSPISNLIIINQLFILPALFGKVTIPQSVKDELKEWADYSVEVKSFLDEKWLKVQACQDRSLLSSLVQKIDPGEAEAIVLAIELHADRLLIDDKDGRQVAESLGIESVGLVGVLIEARKLNLIPSLKDSLNKLSNLAGFRMNTTLISFALKAVNEL